MSSLQTPQKNSLVSNIYSPSPSCPKLQPPLAYNNPTVYQCSGYARVVLGPRSLAAAGMAGLRHVFVTTHEDLALITAGGPEAFWRDELTVSAVGVQLSTSKLPEALREAPLLLVGKGYLVLMPAWRIKDFPALPELSTTSAEHDVSDQPLPARKAIDWRVLVKVTDEAGNKTLHAFGKLFETAGLEAGAPVRVTRHSDGVLLERVAKREANGELGSKQVGPSLLYPYRRLSRELTSAVNGDTVRMIAMKGAIALVGLERKLEEFGLASPQPTVQPAPAGAEIPAVSLNGIRAAYPQLNCWPDLPEATSIILRADDKPVAGLFVPIQLLAHAGLEAGGGLNVATLGNRALIWNGPGGARYFVGEDQRFAISPSGLGTDVTSRRHAIVYGPGYVVVTSEVQARLLAPKVVPVPYEKRVRVGPSDVTSKKAKLPKKLKVLGWRDYPVRSFGSRTRAACVTGNIWRMAGFEVGQAIDATRYLDGTIISRREAAGDDCDPLRLHSYGNTAVQTARLYVGSTLLDVSDLDNVRAIVTLDGLVFIPPQSDMAKQCHPAQRIPDSTEGVAKLHKFIVRNGAAGVPSEGKAQVVMGSLSLPARTASRKNTSLYDLSKGASRIQVQGSWLAGYGFTPGAKFDIVVHPLMPTRRLAVLDDKGPYMVTSHSGDTPKMYVPISHLEDFDCAQVKVFGAVDGIHIQRQLVSASGGRLGRRPKSAQRGSHAAA